MKQSNTLKESFLKFLRVMGDLILLNWLWFFCSLPIITIGPATCAVYAVTLKLVRDESVSTIRDFFRSFRANFKAGLVLGIVVIVLVVLSCGDAYFALQQEGLFRTVFLTVSIIVASVALTFLCYAFALQAMFDNPLKVQIANAIKLAFVSPGKTILMWLICLSPILFALLLPLIAIRMLGFLYMILGFSGPPYWNSAILRNIFDKVNGNPVIPETSEEDEA